MKTLTTTNFSLARNFIKEEARPVDKALFAHTFENGKPDAVWDALHSFANEDGGFGHGMEPDCRLPASSTLGTVTAFPYLIKANAPANHPLVKNGIKYLIHTYDARLRGWHMLPLEANDHPRAVWWNYDPETADKDVTAHWSNPSACAVAYLHRYRELVPADLLREVTDKAMSVIVDAKDTLRGHDYLPFIELAEEVPEPMRTTIWSALKKQAREAIETDPAKWTGYGIRPLWAAPAPTSPLMEPLGDSVNAHLDFEIDRQAHDGSWHPFWSWGQFDDEWEIAKVEWQGQLTVMGRNRQGKVAWHMTGPERAMLYRLAMETGLRSNELRSLSKSSFDLEADPPIVTVAAGYSKRRRNDTLPLRNETAKALRLFLAALTPETKVFKMPSKGNVVRQLLRPDLEEARKQWLAETEDAKERSHRHASDFLQYVDSAGRYADFHALRHSFITNLGRVGVHFKTTQDLARHSTPTLTARYTHGLKDDEVAAVNSLPDLASPRLQEIRATGTDDYKARENSALYSASEGAESVSKVQFSAETEQKRISGPRRRLVANTLVDRTNRDDEDDTCAGRGGRAAEGTGLLNRRRGITPTAGSNPALSVFQALLEKQSS